MLMVMLEFLQTRLCLLIALNLCLELLKQCTQWIGDSRGVMMFNFVSSNNITTSSRASLIDIVYYRR